MHKKQSIATGFGVALVLAMSACGNGAGSPSASGAAQGNLESMDPITLTYTALSSGESYNGIAITRFADVVAKRSNGKVTIEPYFSSSMMSPEETLGGVGSGLADLGAVPVHYFPQELPANNYLQQMSPMVRETYPHGLLSGTAALMDLQSTNKVLQDEFADHNVRLLTASQGDVGQNLLCTEPVDSRADAEGLRVRAGAGGTQVAELEALGMTPVQIPILEAYEALQRGVIDCVALAPTNMVSFALWEVAKHFVPTSMAPLTNLTQVMNVDTWNELPADARAVIEEAAHTMWSIETEGREGTFAEFANEAARHGVVVHDPAPLNAVLAEHHKKVLAGLANSAPASVGDGRALMNEYQSLLDKWYSTTAGLVAVPETSGDATTILQRFITAGDTDHTAFNEQTKSLFSSTS